MNGHELERRDESLERHAREAFDASVARLDAATRARLRDARRAAIDELESRRRPAWQGWAPVAVAASAALLAVLLWRTPAESPQPVAGPVFAETMDALEMVAAGEDLDLVIEDLEFYAWLEQAGYEDGAGGQG